MCMMGVYVSLVLIAFAVGYYVLDKASKAEDSLKKVGKVIGWVIIAVSAVSLVVSLYFSLNCSGRKYCGHMGGKGMYKKMGMKDHMKGTMDKKYWKHMKECPMMIWERFLNI